MMDTQRHIDALFSDYQETPALADFKEELKGHLDERIKNLLKKGMDENAAFEKAAAELGDMSAVADDISKKKKQEVISEMYMKTRNYMSAKRSALYALCGLTLGTALLIPLITWFASGLVVGVVATIIPFGITGVLGFVLLGLTQETAAREAMSLKRALWYALAVGLVLFGVLSALLTYFGTAEFAASINSEPAASEFADQVYTVYSGTSLTGAISVLMVFALPGLALGVFLILTEKDRSKPWVIKQRAEASEYANEMFGDLAGAQRFGLISGALWIAAVALFVVLTMTVGLKFSWLAIVLAPVVQLLIMAGFSKGKAKQI